MPAPIRRVDELGFPLPGDFDDHSDSSARPERTWGRFFYRYRWAVLLLILPLLFGRAIVNGVRGYVAEQLLNRAIINCDQDDYPEALASANRALFWAPDNADRWQEFKVRAEIRCAMQDLDGCVADLNETIKRLNDPASSRRYSDHLRDAYGLRGWVLERLGRHQEAIADSTAALNLSMDDDNRAKYLNSRAYIRALAGKELAEALDDVNRSLIIQKDDPGVIDTRAYILFKLGKLDEASKQIGDAIDKVEHRNRDEAGAPHMWTQDDEDVSRRSYREYREQYQVYRENLAVMYHHRGEIRKKLGQDAAGDEDIRKADFFGYSPERGVY